MKYEKILAIGDIHGGYKGMKQALNKAEFKPEKDLLIVLGDICDGWNDVFEVVEYLSKLPNCIYIIGNHDEWFLEWLNKGVHPAHWLQGGEGTLKSYSDHAGKPYTPELGGFKSYITFYDIPESHRDFFKKGVYYYEAKYNGEKHLYVHGGYNRHFAIDNQHHNYSDILIWDRDLFAQAKSYASMKGYKEEKPKFKLEGDYDHVFIGHTSTSNWRDKQGKPIYTPIIAGPVINLDTGGGWDGVITVMDVQSKQYYQSDFLYKLYPDQKGR